MLYYRRGQGRPTTNRAAAVKRASRMKYSKCEIKEMEAKIRTATQWSDVYSEIISLCDAAGMLEDLKAADGETFEGVIYKAAEKLGVEVE